MSSTNIVILRTYWRSFSSGTHNTIHPVIGDLYLFRILFGVHCVVGALSRIVQAYSVVFFFVVSAAFVCRRRVFVSLTGPVPALLSFRFSAALAVLFLQLWHDKSGSVRNLRLPHPPRRLTCIGSIGSWYHAVWAFKRQLRTLRVFLKSHLGAASRHSGGYTVES